MKGFDPYPGKTSGIYTPEADPADVELAYVPGARRGPPLTIGEAVEARDINDLWERLNAIDPDVGVINIDDLEDVDTTGANVNYVLSFNGTEWVPVDPNTWIPFIPDTLDDLQNVQSVPPPDHGDALVWNGTAGLWMHEHMATKLAELLDVSDAPPAAGTVLTWNGAEWLGLVPSAVTGAFVEKSGDQMTGSLEITTNEYPAFRVNQGDGDYLILVDPSDPPQTLMQGDVVMRNIGGGIRFKFNAATEGTEISKLTKVGGGAPVVGQALVWNGTEYVPTTRRFAINFVIDGGGVVITPGIKGDLIVEQAGVIEGWTILADVSGSCVIDIWRDSYANFPPVVGDAITGATKPTLAASASAQGSPTGWITALGAGDVLRFNVDSAVSVTRLTLELKVRST